MADAFLRGPHFPVIPGGRRRNPETADAAVILPELHLAFLNVFDCTVVGDTVEADLREDSGAASAPVMAEMARRTKALVAKPTST